MLLVVETGLAPKSSDFQSSLFILKETALVGCISKYLERLIVAYMKETENKFHLIIEQKKCDT